MKRSEDIVILDRATFKDRRREVSPAAPLLEIGNVQLLSPDMPFASTDAQHIWPSPAPPQTKKISRWIVEALQRFCDFVAIIGSALFIFLILDNHLVGPAVMLHVKLVAVASIVTLLHAR